ncbi:DUF4421 domain-containing protein [Sphingobacterium sp. E70]|uniref:DUF4421 domain-containing protein n=1 Tax=Sphingobacterium sp. E70 TaxID=2853439 RepID=UPI00211B82BD|nr:DUF4421 domain-containing protein [Sphingobacterium sp. E70]ULT24285.1 DUF4421 domain-containing protein [Sphingobacterium sp. E70]
MKTLCPLLMRRNLLLLFILCLCCLYTKGQEIDTTFIYTYPNASWITSYLSTSAVNMTTEDKTFEPNNPLKIGVGLGIRNTMINFLVGTKIVSLKDKTYGKTSSTDFQVHRYGRKFVTDIYFQRYKGFFAMDGKDTQLFPAMKISQMGLEQTYVFNHTRFSLKAAFERSERQLQSAGSFLLGANVYWHQLRILKALMVILCKISTIFKSEHKEGMRIPGFWGSIGSSLHIQRLVLTLETMSKISGTFVLKYTQLYWPGQWPVIPRMIGLSPME